MITLGPDAPIVDSSTMVQLPLDADRLSVLFHEYAHYLQNITTSAGYHSFRRALDLWCLFRETVGPDGTSRGSSALSSEREKWVAQFLAIGDVFDGEVDSDLPDTFEVASIVITDITSRPHELKLGSGNAHVTEVVVSGVAQDSIRATQSFSYGFGTIAIMEGLAYELDQIVARGASGLDTPKHAAPVFPYQILRNFVLHKLPHSDTRSILRLGCLSLMSNDPAGALLELCRLADESISRGSTLEAAIDKINGAQIHSLIDAIREVDIPSHESVISGGTIARAIAHVHGLFREHLNSRKLDPFLELSTLSIDGCADLEGMSKLFARIPPCVVLQEGGGSEDTMNRDLLWVSGNDAFTLRDELAVLHCAMDFMLSHLGRDDIRKTADIEESACPFYTCCSLPMRSADPDICKQTPWNAVNWTGWQGVEKCWYAAAVSSSVGTKAGSSNT